MVNLKGCGTVENRNFTEVGSDGSVKDLEVSPEMDKRMYEMLREHLKD